ncbi:hypothetical protein B0T20DRAFT_174575 [Sordaria brevicollis]|uniref:RING-type domain-containing protein n=1 Tax=Sordaria brevicollis TaxID=83679 RepID=A0AAE0PHE5_SORBR|nr:hypothetical protein B0T20DRAFT_174575 [Sordaria brevicollis]
MDQLLIMVLLFKVAAGLTSAAYRSEGQNCKMTANEMDWGQFPPSLPPETWLDFGFDDDANYFDSVVVDDGWPPPDPEPPRHDPDTFLAKVIELIPDICPEYARQHGLEHEWNPEPFLNRVWEEESNGTRYPRRAKKRKRGYEDDDADANVDTKESKLQKLRNKYGGQASQHAKDHHYARVSKTLLKEAFPKAYVNDIEEVMKANGFSVYKAYTALHEDFSKPDGGTFRQKSAARNKNNIEQIAVNHQDAFQQGREAQEEFLAAQEVCLAKSIKDAAEAAQQRLETENFETAKAHGLITECGCCYDDLPYNRMVSCDGKTPHWFCYGCVRQLAETQIGQQQYHLGCMSTDGCEATFSRDQQDMCLDDRLKRALEQIEQDDNIRQAGIEGLETCPFCNYAAEYPPIDVNWEFECQQPECGVKSCRRCRQETHIGKSCEEAMAEIARNKGEDAKRKLEEARSLAMIRECYKCNNRFIKESGCNKMTCPRCRAMQCYVCRKPCDYSHFDDINRGGKRGNCPLFERQSLDEIHDKEAQEAEERERKKLLEADPSIDATKLEIKFDEKLFPKRPGHPQAALGVPARYRQALADAIARQQVAPHAQPAPREVEIVRDLNARLPVRVPGDVRNRWDRVARRYAQLEALREQAAGAIRPNAFPNQRPNQRLAGYAAPGNPLPNPVANPVVNPAANPAVNPAPNPYVNPGPNPRVNRNPFPNPAQVPGPNQRVRDLVVRRNEMYNQYMANARFPANVPGWNPGGPQFPDFGFGPLPPNDGFGIPPLIYDMGLPQMAGPAAPGMAVLPPPAAFPDAAANNVANPGIGPPRLVQAPVVAMPPRQQVPVVDLTADE